MSADPSKTEQIVAAVLAEHHLREGGLNFDVCGCGQKYFASSVSRHRAHVAQQIAARLDAMSHNAPITDTDNRAMSANDDGLRAGIEALADSRWPQGHANVGMYCECGHEINSDAGWMRHVLRALLDQTRTEATP